MHIFTLSFVTVLFTDENLPICQELIGGDMPNSLPPV